MPRTGRNIVDFDSDPTKLVDIVEIGKQLLITRGPPTTFLIAALQVERVAAERRASSGSAPGW